MMFGLLIQVLDEDPDNIEETELRKRARYIKKCKEALWRRWSNEYVRALWERHNLKHRTIHAKIAEGNVVVIKNKERNSGKWKIGIIKELLVGRDGVVRGARLRAGKSFVERSVQHLYPLKLQCGTQQRTEATDLDPNSKELCSVRKAAAAGAEVTKLLEEEEEEL